MKKHSNIYGFCLTVIVYAFFYSCFYFHTDVRPLNKDDIYQRKVYRITNPTKVHLIDGSLIIFPNGFKTENNIMYGNGIKYDIYRKTTPFMIIPTDSVAKIIYYDKSVVKNINVEDFEGNITLPARLQLIDNSLIIASQGIERDGNIILCRSDESNSLIQILPDSIATLEYYKKFWQPFPTIASIPAFVPVFIWLLKEDIESQESRTQ